MRVDRDARRPRGVRAERRHRETPVRLFRLAEYDAARIGDLQQRIAGRQIGVLTELVADILHREVRFQSFNESAHAIEVRVEAAVRGQLHAPLKQPPRPRAGHDEHERHQRGVPCRQPEANRMALHGSGSALST